MIVSSLEIILDRFFQIAEQVCNETLAFQPDVVIGLMHSGWLPLFAGMELWQRSQQTSFPPVLRLNLGREKFKRFNQLENRPGVTSSFIGDYELESAQAFFLAWLYGQPHWQEGLRTRIRDVIGETPTPRILIVDEFVHQGSTRLLTVGLLNLIYPKAKIRFYNADIECKERIFDSWIETQHPELIGTEFLPPDRGEKPPTPSREAAVQIVLGTEDIDSESLDWKVIGPSSPRMELLNQYLPVSAWLELPQFTERKLADEIALRAGEYVPNLDFPADPWLQLPPSLLILREIYGHGPVTVQQIAKLLGSSTAKARYHLDYQVGRGYLVVKREGRLSRYALSPATESAYWKNRPLIDTYWAIPGKLLAGEYPGSEFERDLVDLVARLKFLLDAGVTYFIDLTYRHSGFQGGYKLALRDLTSTTNKEVKYTAIPTPRWQLPRRETIQSVLNLLDQALEDGNIVYIHDYISNSKETILGCYYVHRGMGGAEAIQELERVRQGSFDGWRRAPAQERARRLVRKWERPTSATKKFSKLKQ